ncbi:efflux RND transporter permease subunit [Labilibacter marinus]|uniref:efflux RND transporter permease subunit n=1 Tax=Labilibacter marinus TaxID=1477105 RepID=UPI0009503229|nr:MMPL family transporter [Labilibacter marinus]
MNHLSVNHIIIKYRVAILLAILCLTLFFGYQARKVELDYKLAQLLPKTDSTFVEYENFKEVFGEDAKMILLGFKDSTILQLNHFNALYQLTDDIAAIGIKSKEGESVLGTNSVLSLSKITSLNKVDEQLELKTLFPQKPSSQEQLDSVLSIVNKQLFYKDLLYKKSDSTFVTILTITLPNDMVNSKSRIALVNKVYEVAEAFSEHTGIKVYYSGLPYIRTRVMDKVRGELSLFIILAAIVLAIILYLFFRSFRVVATSLLIVGISVVWVFGFIGIFGFKITVLTGLIPPLIIVIGIPNSIFLVNKYHQECSNHGNQWAALERMIKKIGGVIFLTNLTTASGFATFILTSSSILVEFGIIAAINIICLFLISITIFPIITSFQSMPSPKHIKHLENKSLNNIIKWLVMNAMKNRRWVYMGTILLVIISGLGISFIKTSGNVVDDIPQTDDIYKDLLFFEDQFNGVLPFEIVIDTKSENGVFSNGGRTLYKMKKLEKVLSRDTLFTPYFSKPLSVLDGIKYVYQAHRGGDSKYYVLPPPKGLQSLKKYLTTDSSASNDGFNAFVDSTKQIARMTVKMANVNTTQIQALQDSLRIRVDEIFDPKDYTVSFTGTSLVFLKGTNFLIRNLFLSLALAIVLISLFISVMFRSFRMVFISLLPNIIPLLFTAAVMGYAGIHIKPSTILVFSIAFGISIDDSIHFLAKYRQELKMHGGRIKISVVEAIKESGVSMIYTSIVLFFGFSIFTASSFGGTIALGLLVSLTLLVAMFTNLILLPALLLSLEKAKHKKLKKK